MARWVVPAHARCEMRYPTSHRAARSILRLPCSRDDHALTPGPRSLLQGSGDSRPGSRKAQRQCGWRVPIVQRVPAAGQHRHIASLTLRDGTLVGADGPDGRTGVSPSEDGKDGALRSPRRVVASLFSRTSRMARSFWTASTCATASSRAATAVDGGNSAASVSALTAGGAGEGRDGGYATGACIRFVGFDVGSKVGDLILRNSSVTHCRAYAGNGGAGGDGGMGPLFHGVGGAGGIGGDAAGVAISFAGNALTVRNSTVADAVASSRRWCRQRDRRQYLYPLSGRRWR